MSALPLAQKLVQMFALGKSLQGLSAIACSGMCAAFCRQLHKSGFVDFPLLVF
jgi:hypothetical protein